MKMTIQQARDLASTLTAYADAAQAAGRSDFDLVTVLQGLDDDARSALQAAINDGGEP